jgi:Glycosyl hydrolase catalytic core
VALGAPAVTNGVGSGWGINWLRQFFSHYQASACTFDFIPLHWYGDTVLNFKNYVTDFHNQFPNYPLWITEWQFTGITAVQTAVRERYALQWLAAQKLCREICHV